ncbi:MAG: efflux RND transporter permease subunit [Acidobacteria bacterium]|nr:efflux RND transporter permease subunit [Acidobacteriota bacterium]
MFLSDTAIKRPVTVLLFTAGILIFGYIAFQNMGVDLYPEIEFPTVSVSSSLPGADPEIMDSDVTDVLEEQINTIEGVKTIQSTSREGNSQIVVEFVLDKDVNVAAQEVRDKVNLAQRQLPRDLEAPIVQKLDMSMAPFLWVAVTSTGDYQRMARYADEVVKERLQTVPGVGAIILGGYQERQIRSARSESGSIRTNSRPETSPRAMWPRPFASNTSSFQEGESSSQTGNSW